MKAFLLLQDHAQKGRLKQTVVYLRKTAINNVIPPYGKMWIAWCIQMRYFNVVDVCAHLELNRLKIKRVTVFPECVIEEKQYLIQSNIPVHMIFINIRSLLTVFLRLGEVLKPRSCREWWSLESSIGDELVEYKLNQRWVLRENPNPVVFTFKVNEGFWIQWPKISGFQRKIFQ